MADDKVISFPTSINLIPKRAEVFCRCSQVFVIEKTRMLECQKCGKVIEPFDFLYEQAKKQQNKVFSIEHARHELKQLTKEVEELKRKKRNLKASINRANK